MNVFYREPHLVSFHRTGSSLGIQVSGGNAVGIYANAVKDGSPAKLAGLRVGDQILVVCFNVIVVLLCVTIFTYVIMIWTF